MDAFTMLERQGRRLLQVGIGLFLFVSLEGFAIPHVASPPLGLSAHKLASLQGVLLLAFGLVWPRLKLGVATGRAAFWLLIYSTFAILLAYVLGSLWGAGNTTMMQAAGSSYGSELQETLISVCAYSSAPTGIIAFALALWGLRGDDRRKA
jgi:hydroxylaminobenzene mutase